MAKSWPLKCSTMPRERTHSTPIKLTSSSEACSSPMPRPVVISVRCSASAWMRWSGLMPIAPARLIRAARFSVIQFAIRSFVASSRSFSRIAWFNPVCVTFRTSSTAAITKNTMSWCTNAPNALVWIAS